MKVNIDEQSAKNILNIFKSDKVANSNIIVDLLHDLKDEDSKKIRKTIAIINRIFCQLLKDKDLKPPHNIPENVQSARVKYDKWLFDRYNEAFQHLITLLTHQDHQVQQLSLCTIIKLIQMEMNQPLSNEKIIKINFPVKKLERLLTVLLSLSTDNCLLVKRLKEYMEYPDFTCFCLAALHIIVDENKGIRDNDIYTRNLFTLLEMISLPIEGTKSLSPHILFSNCGKGESDESSKKCNNFIFPYKEMKIHFNAIWEIFLNLYFPSDIYKRCLIVIPEKVIMHLDRPVRLTDFFMNAYNLGGASSVMALQGVFILVNQYNLEYPDFYDKVYALFEPTIFQTKYKPRFFMLCDKFFSSTLLPEYIVAAFIKRMSRLILVSPSDSLVLLLKFIVNLLLRYPSLHRMINNPDATNIEDDPFLPEEPNPKLCKAGESSLWEIATLRHHSLCGISKAANFITRNLPDVEHDISKYVENTYDELIEKANKIREPRVFINIYEPENLFKYSEDDMSTSWTVL